MIIKNGDEILVSLGLDEEDDIEALQRAVGATKLGKLEIKKKSIDARRGKVSLVYTLGAAVEDQKYINKQFPKELKGPPVIIIGCGPAGIFASYELARRGIASIICDRGKMVQARRKDLKGLNQHGLVNEDSNYCFGEGGAGTYSDGKLYTRSHKRGNVREVLDILVAYGAPKHILTEARPHIGSNLLPKIITAMRNELESVGVVFHFDARIIDLVIQKNEALGVRLKDGREILGRSVIAAFGHSARDMYEMLRSRGAQMTAKSFAMGVRIEHAQDRINKIQYGDSYGHVKLPPAYYRLAYTPKDGRGAFSFCMCPGGWIVPASTRPGRLLVNGMSLSKRDSAFANSGLVVAITEDDLKADSDDLFAGLHLQEKFEEQAFNAGGGNLVAPAIRVLDFVNKTGSLDLPQTSYLPGVKPYDLEKLLAVTKLPLAHRLREALIHFNRLMPGYVTNEAILVGVESRTSSPVRMLRDEKTLSSNIRGLYPCGEGAGYAGGIMSAAMDGMKIAQAIAQ